MTACYAQPMLILYFKHNASLLVQENTVIATECGQTSLEDNRADIGMTLNEVTSDMVIVPCECPTLSYASGGVITSSSHCHHR